MLLDHRVAHARAKAGLKAIRQDPEVLRRKVRGAIGQTCPLRQVMRCGTRDLRRHLERKLIPALARLDVFATIETAERGLMVMGTAFAGNEDSGFKVISMRLDCTTWYFNCRDLMIIRPHAVARLMQRSGTLDFAQVMPVLIEAIDVAFTFRATYLDEAWQQVGVPAGGGLFVGSIEAGDVIDISSWFVPGANDRKSRWTEYVGYLGARLGVAGAGLPDSRDSLQLATEMHERVLARGSIIERFPFLARPHVRTQDPLNDRWYVAREQAQAECAVAA
jgi:hypothetical protein